MLSILKIIVELQILHVSLSYLYKTATFNAIFIYFFNRKPTSDIVPTKN